MEQIILLHNQGKEGVNLSLDIYNLFRDTIMESFLKLSQATQLEIIAYVTEKLSGTFEGNIAWHVETILPDLIVRQYIEKVQNSEPTQFQLKFFIC